MEEKEVNIYFVDGSGFNCASSSYCIFSKGLKKPIIKIIYEQKIGIEMETLALLECLKICSINSIIYSDSQNLIMYIAGNKQIILESLKEPVKEIKKLIEEKNIDLRWTRREKNEAGKLLERRLEKLSYYKKACCFERWSKRKKC